MRLGTLAVPALQRATKSTDPEQARRAETCLQGIDRQKSPAIIGAAVRLLAVRKPDGSRRNPAGLPAQCRRCQ